MTIEEIAKELDKLKEILLDLSEKNLYNRSVKENDIRILSVECDGDIPTCEAEHN
jgi:ribosomal protein L29